MSIDLNKIEKDIATTEAELARLKKEKEEYLTLGPAAQVAEQIHSLMCRWNHTDGCAWHYESWDKVGDTRRYYLEMGENVVKWCEAHKVTVPHVLNLLGFIKHR